MSNSILSIILIFLAGTFRGLLVQICKSSPRFHGRRFEYYVQLLGYLSFLLSGLYLLLQALDGNMYAVKIKKTFGSYNSFVGGIDVHQLKLKGSPDEIRNKAKELKQLSLNGLVFSPSNEAVLPDLHHQILRSCSMPLIPNIKTTMVNCYKIL